MQQEATVKKVMDGRAVIEVTRKSACAGDCGKCHGCPHPEETVSATAVNEVGAQEGDRVIIESESGQILKLAALVYLMPIVLMAAGYLVMPGSETARVLAGIAALCVGLFICWLVSRRMKKHGTMSFRITQIL